MSKLIKDVIEEILSSDPGSHSDENWAQIADESNNSDVIAAWRWRTVGRSLAILTNRPIEQNRPNSAFQCGAVGALQKAWSASPKDKAIHLRSLLRILGDGRKVKIHQDRLTELKQHLDASSIKCSKATDERMEVSAAKFSAKQISGMPVVPHTLFDLRTEQRRWTASAAADAILRRWLTYETYQSEYQREAVRRIMTAPDNSIILVTLPTGAGKSICFQLPTLHWTRGGANVSGGFTLVIVPTVALAEDQYSIARDMFEPNGSRVARITGDTPANERKGILSDISSGQCSLVFMSPEMALGNAKEAIEMAATNDRLNMIVIDEVHLVETWGSKFRPAVQRIAQFRKDLISKCKSPKIKTVLLTATISPDGGDRIYELMANKGDPYLHINGSSLRKEHDFVTIKPVSDEKRMEDILSLLNHIPRPLILYTTLVKEAESYFEKLQQDGFQRVALFTGTTDNKERKDIIDRWRKDGLDIVVATSAFGLGVDKSDLRAIIHATLPEGIDRFYQEIGRGGRDGFPCLSVLSTTPEDKSVAQKHSLSNLITAEVASSRWKSMVKTGVNTHQEDGLIVWRLNLDDRTENVQSQAEKSGRQNKEWNEGTLLLMERAGIIKVYDFPDEEKGFFLDVEIPLEHAGLVDKPRELEVAKLIKEKRDEEQKRNRARLNNMYKWIDGTENACSTELFRNEFQTPSSGACGRCQYCRSQTVRSVSNISKKEKKKLNFFKVEAQHVDHMWRGTSRALSPKLKKKIKNYPIGAFEYDPDKSDMTNLEGELESLFRRLSDDGVDQFVVPSEHTVHLSELIKDINHCLGFIITRDQFREEQVDNLSALTTVLLFTAADLMDEKAQKIFQAFENNNYSYSKHYPCIALLPKGLKFEKDRLAKSMINVHEVVNARDYFSSLE